MPEYTIDILPIITIDQVKNLFKNMYERINSLETKNKELVESYVWNLFDEYLINFENNFFNPDAIVPKWLASRPPDGTKIESARVYAYMCLQAILEANNNIVNIEDLLTKQEEMLLDFVNCLHDCSIGQREGIEKFYKTLPAKYLLSGKSKDQIVNNLIDISIGKLFENAIELALYRT